MPFGLKNAGATYSRMVYLKFSELSETMEAYIDDKVGKSRTEERHLTHLANLFPILKKHQLWLNAEKCTFGVGSKIFLGHLVIRRDIDVDPNQITSVEQLRPPTNIRKIQKFTGMAATLNKFISRSSDKCHAFFQALKG